MRTVDADHSEGSTMTEPRVIIFEKYEMQRLLGRGSFGSVYYGKRIGTDEPVAIKVMKKADIEEAGMVNQITREISVMGRLRHPNIVKIKEVMATRTKIYLVMEFLEGGELFHRIMRGRIPERDARRYFQQLIGAVEFCHSRGVYHRDIKLENLLLDATHENLKLADFGLSATTDQLHRWDGLLHSFCGAPAYMAPELVHRRPYDGAKADIWSSGVILFSLISGTLPFQDENLEAMNQKIITADYDFPPGFPDGARKLVRKMLVQDPKMRVSIDAIKRDPWFVRGINRSISTARISEMGSNSGRFTNPSESDHELTRSTTMPAFFNAFELISSMASGFDLSSMFEERSRGSGSVLTSRRGTVFTSRRAAEEVVEEIERVVGGMRGCELERVKEFRMKLVVGLVEEGTGLEVMVEVFRSAAELTVVELTCSAGEAAEFVRFCEEEARPALGEIVWTWQGGSVHQRML